MSNKGISSLSQIRSYVKEKVIGQDELVNTVTGTIHAHYVKTLCCSRDDIQKSPTTLLIIGNTGTGKTLTVQETLKVMGLTFIKVDGNRITPEGWQGPKISRLLEEGFEPIQCEPEREYPVVFIDEFDKALRPMDGGKNTDNYHEQIQAAMLRIIDGVQLELNRVKVDTSNFCFIFAGAFSGMFDHDKEDIGFVGSKTEITLKDRLIGWGMVPELAGRINKFIKTNDFTEEMYRDVLCNKNFIYNQWVELLKNKGYTRFGSPNYTHIINEAFKNKLGARGLIQLLHDDLQELMEMVSIRDLIDLHINLDKTL